MSDKTGIEWCDATWNCIRGCTRVSAGCQNCYAQGVAARFSGSGQSYEGLASFVTRPDGSRKAQWTGDVRFVPEALLTPLKWRTPRRIFVNSMSDLFHKDVPDAVIDQIFAVMALAHWHIYIILTKRSARMWQYFITNHANNYQNRIHKAADDISGCPGLPIRWPLPNVWMGVSAEDQPTADERCADLRETPAAVRWVSAEPLLGPIEFGSDIAGLNWIVAGAESGPRARPCSLDWVRSIHDQCAAADVPFFFKQHVVNGKKISLPELDGRQWAEFPK